MSLSHKSVLPPVGESDTFVRVDAPGLPEPLMKKAESVTRPRTHREIFLLSPRKDIPSKGIPSKGIPSKNLTLTRDNISEITTAPPSRSTTPEPPPRSRAASRSSTPDVNSGNRDAAVAAEKRVVTKEKRVAAEKWKMDQTTSRLASKNTQEERKEREKKLTLSKMMIYIKTLLSGWGAPLKSCTNASLPHATVPEDITVDACEETATAKAITAGFKRLCSYVAYVFFRCLRVVLYAMKWIFSDDYDTATWKAFTAGCKRLCKCLCIGFMNLFLYGFHIILVIVVIFCFWWNGEYANDFVSYIATTFFGFNGHEQHNALKDQVRYMQSWCKDWVSEGWGYEFCYSQATGLSEVLSSMILAALVFMFLLSVMLYCYVWTVPYKIRTQFRLAIGN